MKSWMIAGVGAAMLMGGVAVAQTAGAPPPPPPAGAQAPQPGGPHGPDGAEGRHGRWMEMMHHGHRPPPPSKAAMFRFKKGDASVSIKCADDESTKACVDAASSLMDKLNQVK